jgi:hypothetical protein
MKLRIKGNSIRLRLTKTEVQTISETGSFTDKIQFANTSLSYSLQSYEGEAIYATFEENNIIVHLPVSFAKPWYENDIIGTKNIQSLPDGGELFILIEKDFVCMDATYEDQSDNYPHP